MLVQSRLGDNVVLVDPRVRTLHVLNPTAGELWELCGGKPCSPQHLARALVLRYGLADDHAEQEATRVLHEWQCTGLFDATPAAPEEPWILPPAAQHWPDRAGTFLRVAGCMFSLTCEDARLRHSLEGLLARVITSDPKDARRYGLQVIGRGNDWKLLWNGEARAAGDSPDAAAVAVISTVYDLASRSADRLMVAHGAAVATAAGTGILLIAAGGSGKTTLSTALNARGYGLLSDDVVPVDRAGRLVPMGLPICVKAGSWQVLKVLRPDVDEAMALTRLGLAVRYLQPLGPRLPDTLPCGLMVFPLYQPGAAPTRRALAPEEALQRIIEAEAVIRDLDRQKLDDLMRWVAAIPAVAITYPSLEASIDLFESVAADYTA